MSNLADLSLDDFPEIKNLAEMSTKSLYSSDKFYNALETFQIGRAKTISRPFDQHQAVYQFQSWIYGAVSMNAKALATTPLHLYARTRTGKKNLFKTKKVSNSRKKHLMGDNPIHASTYVMNKSVEFDGEFEEVVGSHPITDLLRQPNPYMDGFEFAQLRSIFLQLTGNSYLQPIMQRGSGYQKVAQLLIAPSQFMQIVPGKGSEFIAGYEFGVNRNDLAHFEPDEILHQKTPNPRNSYYGLGCVEAAWGAVKIHTAQREQDQAKFDNQSRPDLVVITKSATGLANNKEQLIEMQEEWARIFRGTFKSGSPAFLSGDTQVIPLNWMPVEMGDREITLEEIALCTGVPVSLLKTNDPNRANAEVGKSSWLEGTILPACKADEMFLNGKLIPLFGLEDDCFLAYESPMPPSQEDVRKDIDLAMRHGTMTRNEIRVEQGLTESNDPNADKLLVPANLVPIESAGIKETVRVTDPNASVPSDAPSAADESKEGEIKDEDRLREPKAKE